MITGVNYIDAMYIKKVTKRNGKTDKKYTYLHLVDTVRTEKGPRQRLILNLGKIDIAPDKYKELANCIEGMLTGQTTLLSQDNQLTDYASCAVNKILKKNLAEDKKEPAASNEPDVKNIDLNSINEVKSRSIGAEYICHTFWEKLGIDSFLASKGLSKDQSTLIESVVLGRLISPGSERHTHNWISTQSAIHELSGTPVHHYSERSFYRASETVFSFKDDLEQHLNNRERELFSLTENLCLFDLTNTFLEGEAKGNGKAKHGRSKEKRSDCRLLTLALIVDENGFAKYSRLYSGNQSEPSTMKTMIGEMAKANPHLQKDKTIIMDAGIASEENIKYLKENGYNYIVVNKGKSPFISDDTDRFKTIRTNSSGEEEVKVTSHIKDDETYLLCWSRGREKKEEAMKSRQEELFLERIDALKSGLDKKRRMKKYSKIVEAIGRIREKYPTASKRYNITVEAEDDDLNKNASNVVIAKRSETTDAKSKDGCYVLRTNRNDLDDNEIWEIYCMLTRIENSFRSMKSSLGLRPIYHQNETSSDAHMFISVIAYHILHSIEYTLRLKDDTRSWKTIRDIMSTHRHILLEYDEYDDDGNKKHNFISMCSKPESPHMDIYKKLDIKSTPVNRTHRCSDEKKITSQ